MTIREADAKTETLAKVRIRGTATLLVQSRGSGSRTELRLTSRTVGPQPAKPVPAREFSLPWTAPHKVLDVVVPALVGRGVRAPRVDLERLSRRYERDASRSRELLDVCLAHVLRGLATAVVRPIAGNSGLRQSPCAWVEG